MFQALLMALEIYLVFAFLRFIFRWIRYVHRLHGLKKIFKQMEKKGVNLTFRRKLHQIVFGKQGGVDIVLSKDDKKYGIALLTHRLSMGRWNIEKTRKRFFFEVYLSTVFYRLNNSSENIPDHVKEFGREREAVRKELNLTTPADGYDKLFLLVFPTPRHLTYTETRHRHISAGDHIQPYEVIFADQLPTLFS